VTRRKILGIALILLPLPVGFLMSATARVPGHVEVWHAEQAPPLEFHGVAFSALHEYRIVRFSSWRRYYKKGETGGFVDVVGAVPPMGRTAAEIKALLDDGVVGELVLRPPLIGVARRYPACTSKCVTIGDQLTETDEGGRYVVGLVVALGEAELPE
jgi:hypothetical protein